MPAEDLQKIPLRITKILPVEKRLKLVARRVLKDILASVESDFRQDNVAGAPYAALWLHRLGRGRDAIDLEQLAGIKRPENAAEEEPPETPEKAQAQLERMAAALEDVHDRDAYAPHTSSVFLEMDNKGGLLLFRAFSDFLDMNSEEIASCASGFMPDFMREPPAPPSISLLDTVD
jgi:hypothetical protein